MANAHPFSEESATRLVAEWQKVIRRDYNHPCIVAWAPLNESWGVPRIRHEEAQAHHAIARYHLTKSLDPSRPVIANDGWEHTRTALCTIHDYEAGYEALRARYGSLASALSFEPAGRSLFAPGYQYEGQPLIVSECGGIAFRAGDVEGWGYSEARDESDFLARFQAVISAIQESPLVAGYCYTQFTDVEQEINGLLTCDRKKVPLQEIRRITAAGGVT